MIETQGFDVRLPVTKLRGAERTTLCQVTTFDRAIVLRNLTEGVTLATSAHA